MVFGLADGKVKAGKLKVNKAAVLYETDSLVVSLASSRDGHQFVSGHMDGTVHLYTFESGDSAAAHVRLFQHPCAPVGLSWGEAICAAGSDRVVSFYDRKGRALEKFDYSNDDSEHEFSSAAFSPAGDTCIVGSFSRLRGFTYNSKRRIWELDFTRDVRNFYTVTAMGWRADGSRLAVGSSTGAVDEYTSSLKRINFKGGKFVVNFVSQSQLLVSRQDSSQSVPIASSFGEISKINIYHDRYVVAYTAQTLIICDMSPDGSAPRASEIHWNGGGNEKFGFDNPHAAMVFNAGELCFVEYGSNEILGSCRTEHVSSPLVSVRIGETKKAAREGIKKVAYLIDLQTIVIMDIPSGRVDATVSHDSRVDWLELNGRASKLLFRDRKRHLFLYDVATAKRTTLLTWCQYVQWVPNSDVVVAQNRSTLSVWYSIDTPDRVKTIQINGDVEEIVRSDSTTEVIVDEGLQKVAYALDEPLIEFGASVEDEDFGRAVRILEAQGEMSPEIEAMWRSLSVLALDKRDLLVAERCFAALGDVAKARYLRKLNKLAAQYKAEGKGGVDHFAVTAKLALLDHLFERAAAIYLSNGQVEDAMDMYQELHRWDECIAVAESKNHADVANLRRDYFSWLLDTQQFEKAGGVKEKEGDHVAAINLYLKGGLPAKAASLVKKYNITSNPHLLETIATGLQRAGMYEKAGLFLEQLNRSEEALVAYRKGHNYRYAVELARRIKPTEVVKLEQEWAEWEVSQHQVDAAINHFIEAGLYVRALEAAIDSWQWAKAVQIADNQNSDVVRPYYRKIAKHYEESRNFKDAEKYYVKGGFAEDAVNMYTREGMFDRAVAVASSYLPDGQVTSLNIAQAQRLELDGKPREAEKFYVAVHEYDEAINMYRKVRDWDNMIRLVRTYRKDMLSPAHLQIAQELESESKFKEAEQHYIHAGKWQLAVNMYRANDLWDDCVRVAKLHGGDAARKRVLFERARTLGLEEGSKLLVKHAIVDDAVEDAIVMGQFDYAFKLANAASPAKVVDVHYKYALHLEDEGRFDKAEESFVKANKPKEAIDMYTHQQDWAAALRVAENYDPRSVSEILVMQAKVAVQNGDFARAEELFLRARKPEAAVAAFKEAGRWPDVLRIAREHLPRDLPDLEAQYAVAQKTGQSAKARQTLQEAAALYDQRSYSKAIDTYLSITQTLTSDHDFLEGAWETAVDIAMKHDKARVATVVATVAQRLCAISRFDQAAEICESIEDYQGAIRCYTQGGMYDKARKLQEARGIKPVPQQDSGMGGMGGGGSGPSSAGPQSRSIAGNVGGGSAAALGGDLASGGDANFDALMRKGQWDRVFQEAQAQSDDVLRKYVGIRAAALASERNAPEALRLLAKYGAPSTGAHYNTYRLLTKEVLSSSKLAEEAETVQNLRAVLYSVVTQLIKNRAEERVIAEFSKSLRVAHTLSMKSLSLQKGLKDLAAKAAVSAVRYCDLLAADHAFYTAGMLCRDVKMSNTAFVFLNRFLDLAEAMAEPDSSGVIENADFEHTDVPFDFPLPEHSSVPAAKREEVRDWILTVSVDPSIGQELSTRTCDKCGTSVYNASLSCYSCNTSLQPCCVTGFPVLPSKAVKCSSCSEPANRDDWNKLIAATRACPWCSSSQSPTY